MAWRFVKQPDGRLARFSDIVDKFTHVNLSQDDAMSVCAGYGMTYDQAIEKVRGGTEDWKLGMHQVPGSGDERWKDALETIEFQHGAEGLKEVLKAFDKIA